MTAVFKPPSSGFADSVDRKALIAEARAWASDCAWRDSDEIAGYSDEEIIRGVNTHYEGGIDQLARNALLEPVPPPVEASVPVPLPQPRRTHGWDGKPLTDAGKRFFALRESGYRGWIDQDGHAVSDAEHARRLQETRTRADMGTARFDPPPAAKPYTPSPSTPGATMSASIQEIRGVLAGASDAISDSQGPIQRAIDEAIQARAALMAAMDGSNQADVDAQIATLTAMIDDLEAALGRSHQAITGNQQIGARL